MNRDFAISIRRSASCMFASAVFIGSCKSDLVWSALSQSAAAKVLRKKQLLQLLIPVTIVVRVFKIGRAHV